MTTYDSYERNKSEVQSMLDGLAEILIGLQCQQRADVLRSARAHLSEDSFRLFVVGEFKRGKSTFVNALLGEDILPAKLAPCTALVTHVKYAEQPGARLYPKDQSLNPLQISVQDLRKYVIEEAEDEDVDLDEAEASEEAIRRSPYERAEVYYPLALCKNNVEVIDSPGLNEHESRSEVTLSAFKTADAFIIVLGCDQFLSKSELNYIKNDLKDHDLRHAFIVCNRYDIAESRPESEREELRTRARKYLVPRLGSEEHIFWISSLNALRGKKTADAALLKGSGMPTLEKKLEHFLTTQKGRVKLMRPIRFMASTIHDLLAEILPNREMMYSQKLEDIEQKFEQQRPALDKVRLLREKTLDSITRRRDVLIQLVTSKYENFISKYSELGRAYARSLDLGLLEGLGKSGRAKQRLGEELSSWFQREHEDWLQNQLFPMLEKFSQDLEKELAADIQNFDVSLNNIRAEFSLQGAVSANSEEDVTALGRVLGASLGLLIGGVGSGIEGATMGTKRMLRGALPNIVLGTILIAASTNPLTMIGVLAAAGVTRTLLKSREAKERILNEVGEEFAKTLSQECAKLMKRLNQQVSESMGEVLRRIDDTTKIRLDEVEGQISAILNLKRTTQSDEQALKSQLREVKVQINTLYAQLQKLQGQIDNA